MDRSDTGTTFSRVKLTPPNLTPHLVNSRWHGTHAHGVFSESFLQSKLGFSRNCISSTEQLRPRQKKVPNRRGRIQRKCVGGDEFCVIVIRSFVCLSACLLDWKWKWERDGGRRIDDAAICAATSHLSLKCDSGTGREGGKGIGAFPLKKLSHPSTQLSQTFHPSGACVSIVAAYHHLLAGNSARAGKQRAKAKSKTHPEPAVLMIAVDHHPLRTSCTVSLGLPLIR